MTEILEKDDNVIYIGDKPFMNYVTSVVMQFVTKKREEVIIKARGRFITRAVDVAETTKKRFLENIKVNVSNVKIGSEEFQNKEGKNVNVSIIEITLKKE
jgi:DNA-binding protein